MEKPRSPLAGTVASVVACVLVAAACSTAARTDDQPPPSATSADAAVTTTLPGIEQPGDADAAAVVIAPPLESPYPQACRTPLPDHTIAPLGDWSPQPVSEGDLIRVATATDGTFTVHTAGGDRVFLNGVNLGATLPGAFPNDWAAGRRTYDAWLRQIGELGFRSIRTYTVHPGAFYQALAAHNERDPARAIYLVQGVWFPEPRFAETADLYDPDLTRTFEADITAAVQAVTGRLDPAEDPRLGRYTADVTPWLAGFIIGVEWDPHLIAASDAANAGRRGATGTYVVSTDDGSPTEVWLGARLDHLAAELADAGVSAPISFTNWATTDPLDHPTERLPEEDLIGIDATHVLPTERWPGGVFATFHAYPYFPDFQGTEPALAGYLHRGVRDPFAGYLAQLRDHHGAMPVVIAETGVPGGWGSAGDGPVGRAAGGHLERTQMRINAQIVDTAADLGLGGVFLFEWADEWFKTTWNTAGLEVPPESRARWHNLLSAEQHFGILAVEPTPPVVLDGFAGEWTPDLDVGTDDGVRVAATHDAGGVYVMVRGEVADVVEIRFDTDPRLNHLEDRDDRASDVSVVVSRDSAEIRERLPYTARTEPPAAGDLATAVSGPAGTWEPFAMLTAYAGADGAFTPATTHTINPLRRSRADLTGAVPPAEAGWARTSAVLEVRVPWAVLGVADPSSGTAIRFTNGIDLSTRTRMDIRVLTGAGTPVGGSFEWEGWSEPHHRERLKTGSGTLAAALCRSASVTSANGA